MNKKFCLLFALIILILSSCKNHSPVKQNYVIVGLSSDLTTLSPLFAFSLDEGSITELLFLSLVRPYWNYEEKDLGIQPMLAKSWEWSSDSSSITFNLRDDVKWSDGKNFTAKDIVFSFDVYSDPVVESRFYGTFQNYYLDKGSEHINLKKTFEVISDYKLKINFQPGSSPNLYDLSFPIIPSHVYEKIERKNYATCDQNFNPVTNGSFNLGSWEKNKSLILNTNENSFLHKPGKISKLIFKIIPDYNARLTQLKKGEIDLMELIKPDDAPGIEKKNINIVPVKGREYDYIGWNNIDYEFYKKNKIIIPNKLFGDPKVRVALAHAINRREILKEFLGNFGQIAVSPISPIFEEAINSDIKPYSYDPQKAKQLLAEEGWKDSDKDGILEKNRKKFAFTMLIPSGNPRREYASTIVKNNLREVGIDVDVQQMELNVFLDKLYDKTFDSYMASLFVPLPILLKPFWYSDIRSAPQNFTGFQNRQVDEILDKMQKNISKKELNNLYHKFQELIHKEQPVTFLYWTDNLVGYNKRIQNININPLGVVQECWNWSVNN